MRRLTDDSGEIAEFLGISKDLVRMRYKRAREMLLKKGGDALYEASKF